MAVYTPTTLAPTVDDNKKILLRKIGALFAGSANGRAPITVTGLGPPPSPLAQIDFNADKASFTGGANGYTGSADLDSFQREVTTNTLRNGHFFGAGNTTGPCVILETSPTLCVLVAPGNLVASANGDGTVDVSWDDIPVTANRAAFNWRLVGNAITGWTSSGTATGFSTSPSAGTYKVEVRAVSTSGVAGMTATSAPFTVTSGGLVQKQTQGNDADYNHLANGTRLELASSFVAASTYDLVQTVIHLRKVGSPTMTLSFLVYTDDGADHPDTLIGTATTVVNAASLSTSFSDVTATFSAPVALTNGVKYYISVLPASQGDGSNYVDWSGNPAGVGIATGRDSLVSPWVLAQTSFSGTITNFANS